MTGHVACQNDDSRFRDNTPANQDTDTGRRYMRSTHQSIIGGVQGGNQDAQRRFWLRYFEPCSSFYEAGRWRFDRQTSESLAADVLEKLIEKKLTGYQTHRRFRPYLFTVLRHHAIDYMQKNPPSGLEQSDSEVPETEPAWPADELAFVRRRVEDILKHAIDRAKEKELTGSPQKGRTRPFDVDIFLAVECGGQALTEMANKWKLTPEAVRAAKRTGRMRLRKAIEDYLSEEEEMTRDEIDDEIHDLREGASRLPSAEPSEKLEAAIRPTDVLQELEELAGLTAREIWEEIGVACADLGWEYSQAAAARLLGVQEDTIERWLSEKEPSLVCRRQMAAVCLLLSLIERRDFTAISDKDRQAIFATLRGQDNCDEATEKEILASLARYLGSPPPAI